MLKDEDGAHDVGHEALAGELRNGKLKYVSKNGGKYMVFELRGEIIKNFNTLNDIYNYYLLLIFETRR